MQLPRSLSVGLLAVAAAALVACGGEPEATTQQSATDGRVAEAAQAEAQAEAEAAAQAEAAAERAAAAERQAAAAEADRAEARDRKRGDALLQSYIAIQARDRWSIMDVTVDGGAVTVHTDLPPGNEPAFTGACTQLTDHESWIDTIAVVGTDGASHASWSKGDAFCSAAAG